MKMGYYNSIISKFKNVTLHLDHSFNKYYNYVLFFQLAIIVHIKL